MDKNVSNRSFNLGDEIWLIVYKRNHLFIKDTYIFAIENKTVGFSDFWDEVSETEEYKELELRDMETGESYHLELHPMYHTLFTSSDNILNACFSEEEAEASLKEFNDRILKQ